MNFLAYALLAIAAISAVRAENPNGGLDKPFLREKRDDTKSTGKQCEPFESFKKYCNWCTCFPNGTGSWCATKKCPEGVYNENGGIKLSGLTEPCEPHSHFLDNCHNCVCNADGLGARCEDANCADVECTPGIDFKVGCTVCVCQPSGMEMICRKKNCPTSLMYGYRV